MAFGGLHAVCDVSLEVKRGQIHGIIGPNGAGKTTSFNLITGIYKPTSGDIFLEGRSICGYKPHEIVALGIARTFQNIRLFNGMTVMENVQVGQHTRSRAGILGALFRLPRVKNEETAILERARHELEFMQLYDKREELAQNLPYGSQRRLEIARALASEPKVLLLDEPAAGMNHNESKALVQLIDKVRERGISVVLVEHDMDVVMTICDQITVLDYGQKIASGVPTEIQANEQVIEAYLGQEGAFEFHV